MDRLPPATKASRSGRCKQHELPDAADPEGTPNPGPGDPVQPGLTDTAGPEPAPVTGGLVFHTLGARRVLREEGVDEKRGLSSAEAVSRARRFGPKQVRSGEAAPRWWLSSASTAIRCRSFCLRPVSVPLPAEGARDRHPSCTRPARPPRRRSPRRRPLGSGSRVITQSTQLQSPASSTSDGSSFAATLAVLRHHT